VEARPLNQKPRGTKVDHEQHLNGQAKRAFPDGSIYLFQPGYAGGNARSHEAFWAGALLPGSRLQGKLTRVTCYGMSLLANAFNQGFCHSLNLRLAFEHGERSRLDGKRRINPYHRKEGKGDQLWEHWNHGFDGDADKRIDFFVMLHDDVVPDDGWVEVLHGELRRNGADLLSAVVPFKDGRGLTSTGIGIPGPERHLLRRLALAEVFALPETFTAADCGYPGHALLANTGCWIVRLDLPCFRQRNPDGSLKLRFNIEDKVVFNEGLNQWQVQTVSEDWLFSFDFQELGGKVACTRKVKLSHVGAMIYDNRSPDWGVWNTDKESAHHFGGKPVNGAELPGEAEGVPVVATGWSKEYPEVRGWFKDIEGELLADLADGKEVLEIGSFCGLSTLWLLRTARKVHCVDTFDGRGTPILGGTFEEFAANLERRCPDKCDSAHVAVYRAESADVLPKLAAKGAAFDLAFIDGAHDEASVEADTENALKVLKPGGLLAFHDFGSEDHPEVSNVVGRLLLSKGAELLAVSGMLAVVDPAPMLEKEKIENEAVDADAASLHAIAGLEGDNVP
jgi:SAM-dependent methyltransferase